jgi:hypothetical protein
MSTITDTSTCCDLVSAWRWCCDFLDIRTAAAFAEHLDVSRKDVP